MSTWEVVLPAGVGTETTAGKDPHAQNSQIAQGQVKQAIAAINSKSLSGDNIVMRSVTRGVARATGIWPRRSPAAWL